MRKISPYYASVIAALACLSAGTARADEWRDHSRAAHEWRRGHVHHDHYHHHVVIEHEPPVVYAPPVIVEPPVPEGGVNLVFPLNVR